tara:strand:+ start:9013 stop:9681 length:669 start_codon:yes stop_codon:yes gene_type:complete
MATKIDELPSNTNPSESGPVQQHLHTQPGQQQPQQDGNQQQMPMQSTTYNPKVNIESQQTQSGGSSITPGFNLSKEDVNKIITGIQQASQSNLTSLPSRDIPMTQDKIMMDEESHNPNYIPKQPMNDYIRDGSNYENVIKQQYDNEKLRRENEDFFDEIKIPILISILFFIFQLPIIRRTLLDKMPTFFLNDGNMSFNGITIFSLAFGLFYYLINKFVLMNI